MNNYTYSQIANSYTLWTEYADVDGVMTREQFDNMTEAECIAILTDMFGAEQAQAQDDEAAIDSTTTNENATNSDNRDVLSIDTRTQTRRDIAERIAELAGADSDTDADALIAWADGVDGVRIVDFDGEAIRASYFIA